MAAYAAFVKVILNYEDGETRIVSKQFDNPNEYIGWVDEATASFNESIGTYSMLSYTIIEKVNSKILNVEHVDYDARRNFVMRQG